MWSLRSWSAPLFSHMQKAGQKGGGFGVVPTKCFWRRCFSCRKLYSFVVYLYVNSSGSITSVGEERANLSAVVYL